MRLNVVRGLIACAVWALLSLSCREAASAGGKLLATGGLTELEGAGGGAIVPWALIGGTETRDETGGTAAYTHLQLTDYTFDAAGVLIGIKDRLELSYHRQSLGISNSVTTPVAAALKLPVGTLDGTRLNQDVFGVKLKLFGDAVFGPQHSILPQVSIGAQFKDNTSFNDVLGITSVPKVLGAKQSSGTDYYLAATKLVLGGAGGYNLLVNATVRETKANALGLLGFGGDKNDRYQPQFEGSAGIFLNPMTAFGGEYRTQPDNLSATKSEPYKDLFVAWFPNKNLSLLLAYANLGNLPGGFSATGVTKENGSGIYFTATTNFP